MTLEDFFTLTEMKDGLAVHSRVQELIAAMKKEKDCVVKNVGDATRQWAAVASTIAATDNKDCLDLFIQLDGLWFIDRWLKDAQKLSTDTSDGFVDESVTALLKALEKLQLDKERSVSTGIWVTVNKLIDHHSSQVRDGARALFDSWNNDKIMDASNHNVNVVTFRDVTNHSIEQCVSADILLSKGGTNVENYAVEPAADDNLHLRSSNCVQTERGRDVPGQTNNSEFLSEKSLDHFNCLSKSAEVFAPSISSNSGQERPAVRGESPIITIEGTGSTDTRSCPGSDGYIAKPDSDISKTLSVVPRESGMIASAPSNLEPGAVSSSTDGASAPESVNESALQNNFESKGRGISQNDAALHGRITVGIDSSDREELKSMAKDVECPVYTSQDVSSIESKVEKPENLERSFSLVEDVGASNREASSNGAEDVGGSDLSKPSIDTGSSDLPDRRRSDIELDYGIVDALEVARQVAQEVEREMEDFRDRSCSSSLDKSMETDIRLSETPDSLNQPETPSNRVLPEDKQVRENQSSGAHSEVAMRLIASDTLRNESERDMHELEKSQVTEVAEDLEFVADKSLCEFDLNQEVCSDDKDHPVNPVISPISVVSASRLAVTSGSPAAPLQFEGSLGWKGSAATSAFRPASPWKVSDGDRSIENGGTSSILKQRRDWLDIDLNIAEGGDDMVSDLLSVRQITLMSSLHSRESSLEVGPRRSERTNLDLNRVSDDSDALLSDLRMEGQVNYSHNGHRSPSPASSSSSMQVSLRNFDLNNGPLYQNYSSDQQPNDSKSSQIAGARGGINPGDPVISIMGTRVEVGARVGVNRKEFMDANVPRIEGVLRMGPSESYTNPPVFGYNGLAVAASLPISSAMYGAGGPIPCMVDSRGTPVMPQILGSAPAVAAQFSQPPFIMSMVSAAPGVNGAGHPRPNFDLNSGIASEGGGSGGSLRQFLMPSQIRAAEEYLRANPQPSSSSAVGAKRKEPESGWEPYSLQYRPWR